MKLKLELFRYGNLVVGKVLEQAEELRGRKNIVGKNGFVIGSINLPELNDEKLFIRGNYPAQDDRCFFNYYTTETKAIEICKTIAELVDEINKDSETKKTQFEKIL